MILDERAERGLVFDVLHYSDCAQLRLEVEVIAFAHQPVSGSLLRVRADVLGGPLVPPRHKLLPHSQRYCSMALRTLMLGLDTYDIVFFVVHFLWKY